MAHSQDEVVAKVKTSDHQKVKVAITDLDGVLRGKYINKDKFLSAMEGGFGFCNVVFGWDCADVCYDNVSYTGWHTGYPDAQVQLDPSTYRTIPWNGDVPLVLGDFVKQDGKPLEVCPRQLLRQVVAKAADMGMIATCGVEYEWFNFRETPASWAEKGYMHPEPLTPGMFGYSVLRSSYSSEFFDAIMDDMGAFGVPLEGLHTETGPGVYEAAIQVCEAVEAGDRAMLFKTGLKEIAYRFGIMPSFMAKWDATLPGCSGHIHQSLWDAEMSNNLFYDANDPHKMSETFKQYLAGQMLLMPQVLPMFAPTVNSYKRLVEGLWAPTRVTWASDNRTASFRVIPGSNKSTRLETRVGGSDMNAYLSLAASIATGLYGIEKKLKLEDAPVVGNAYEAEDAVRLPGNLHDAAVAMDKSEIARELFGDTFVDHMVQSRMWEWRQFQQAVTSWEMQRYFEIV